MPRTPSAQPRQSVTSVRLTVPEREEMEEAADSLGFASLSHYIRHLHQQEQARRGAGVQDAVRREREPRALHEFHRTERGVMYNGDSLDYLLHEARPGSVDLIMTSPPFGLVRKKSYGNEDADQYCEWFRPFAEGFRRVLKERGSLVIDIGGAWKPGLPTRSLYHFELLIMLCREYGFHLCLEHFWWNPAKLPTPAEWVNVRRVRVKDAVNCVWWLSPSPFPRASNRRVLAPYSDSMRDLLKNGYDAKTRPSGHVISDKFQRDNGGSVPPNLLAIANTESNGQYQDYCRRNGLDIHPARFPSLLPEYFIRFLTDPGDLVVDPFGGSCVTGVVAERLKRRWACIELNTAYLQGALARFQSDEEETAPRKGVGRGRGKKAAGKVRPEYTIATPCAVDVDEVLTPLVEDGGQARPAVTSAPSSPAPGPG